MAFKIKSISGIRVVAIATLVVAVGCSKKIPPQILIDVPANFSGQVHVEMGVAGAPALVRDGPNYKVEVPPDGKVVTSTIIDIGTPNCRSAQAGRMWGYAATLSKTGDGIPVGGDIEFFVGTKEQYESAEAKKHGSKLYPAIGREFAHRS